jgi:hypothetical protein
VSDTNTDYWEPTDPEWSDVDVLARTALRNQWVARFLEESPGDARIKAVRRRSRTDLPARELAALPSRTEYEVGHLATGEALVLVRPAIFNWGIDFTFVIRGSTDIRPSHGDLGLDVAAKLRENRSAGPRLYAAIEAVYRCKDPTVMSQAFADLDVLKGWPIERLLHACYWLFLEADITYWNLSGRRMTMEHIRNQFRSAPVLLPGGRWVS